MSILCKFRQIRPFNRDFFEPLVIFCCNLSAWAQKWQRQHTETPASTEICDKTTFLGQFSYKTSKFGPNSSNLDPLTEFFWNPCSFFVVFYQPEHKNDKDNTQKHRQVPKFATKQRFWVNFHTKRPNLGQIRRIWTLWPSSFETLAHFLLYSIRLSTKMTKTITQKHRQVPKFATKQRFWVNFHTKRPNLGQIRRIWTLWPSSFETLGHFLLYSIRLSTKMTKTINTNAGKYRNLQSKTTFWAQFPYKTSKFEPNVAKFECFSEFSLNLWSFFVVSYQAEQENAQGLQDIHW